MFSSLFSSSCSRCWSIVWLKHLRGSESGPTTGGDSRLRSIPGACDLSSGKKGNSGCLWEKYGFCWSWQQWRRQINTGDGAALGAFRYNGFRWLFSLNYNSSSDCLEIWKLQVNVFTKKNRVTKSPSSVDDATWRERNFDRRESFTSILITSWSSIASAGGFSWSVLWISRLSRCTFKSHAAYISFCVLKQGPQIRGQILWGACWSLMWFMRKQRVLACVWKEQLMDGFSQWNGLQAGSALV